MYFSCVIRVACLQRPLSPIVPLSACAFHSVRDKAPGPLPAISLAFGGGPWFRHFARPPRPSVHLLPPPPPERTR